MKTYSISQLARSFGLSRSTLLYYGRIGLLAAPERTAAGYRRYTQSEYDKLERICMFRGVGLPLKDVQKLLQQRSAPSIEILEKQLKDLESQALIIRGQQHAIIAMLEKMTDTAYGPIVDKAMWVKMLKAAGMDESSMQRWHAEFERRAPTAHNAFLLSLGIPDNETQQIRKWSREIDVPSSDHHPRTGVRAAIDNKE